MTPLESITRRVTPAALTRLVASPRATACFATRANPVDGGGFTRRKPAPKPAQGDEKNGAQRTNRPGNQERRQGEEGIKEDVGWRRSSKGGRGLPNGAPKNRRPWAVVEDHTLAKLSRSTFRRDETTAYSIAWGRDVLYVQYAGEPEENRWLVFFPSALRDGCTCSRCRNEASGQKNFSTTEIPLGISFRDVMATETGLAISFEPDIERLAGTRAEDSDLPGHHETLVRWEELDVPLRRSDRPLSRIRRDIYAVVRPIHWDRAALSKHIRKLDYNSYMLDDSTLWDAVRDISRFGIVIVKNVPPEEKAVEDITTRIGSIQETFYGRTFDVRAKPDAENVAYTSGHLGLHQDLLYLDSPPKIQLLHCIENSCEGGHSLFSDADRVGKALVSHRTEPILEALTHNPVAYGYDRNGNRRHQERRLLEVENKRLRNVWWSPPFTAPAPAEPGRALVAWIAGARVFESMLNDEASVFRYKLEPGECVIFDNRRVAHGRTAFDPAAGGSRWLRGAYIAEDVFLGVVNSYPSSLLRANDVRPEPILFPKEETLQRVRAMTSEVSAVWFEKGEEQGEEGAEEQ